MKFNLTSTGNPKFNNKRGALAFVLSGSFIVMVVFGILYFKIAGVTEFRNTVIKWTFLGGFLTFISSLFGLMVHASKDATKNASKNTTKNRRKK